MPRTIEAEGPAWEALKDRAEALAATCSGGQVDLLALAKAYAAFAVAIGEAAEAAGQTSMRFEAAAKALDLRTPRSALTAFLDR